MSFFWVHWTSNHSLLTILFIHFLAAVHAQYPYYNNATVSSNATSSLTSILSSSISSSISSSSQTTGLNSGSTRPQSPSSFGSEFATETHSPEAASIFPSASGNVHVNNGLSGALASSSTNTDNASASLPPSPTTELGSAHSIAPNITLSLIENSNVSVSGSISTDAPEYSPLAVVDHDNSSIEPSNSRTIIYGKNSSNVPDLNKTPFQQAPSSASTTIISFSNNSTKQAENPSATPEITPTPTTNHTSESYFQNQGSGGYRNGRYKRPQTGSSGYPGNSHNITTSFAYNSLYQNQNPYNTTLFPYNIYPPNPSLESRCGSSWLSEKSDSPVVPPAASPCCLNCTLFGGDVQVFVWPTPRPTPLVNTVYDELGHTFISPSVYVAFNQLSATNLCGALGETYYSTTLAFASNGLFTSIAPVINNNKNPEELKNQVGEYEWTAFNPDDLLGDCTSKTSNSGGVTFSYNPCSPMLSVPFSIFQIDNNWTTCLPGISAFYDPPRTLTPADGLLLSPVTDAPKHNPTHHPAEAGPVLAPVTAHATESPKLRFARPFGISVDAPIASVTPVAVPDPLPQQQQPHAHEDGHVPEPDRPENGQQGANPNQGPASDEVPDSNQQPALIPIQQPGSENSGQPQPGQEPAEPPTSGQPAGQPPAGQSAPGQPATGQPPAGQPPAGQPASGQPPAGQPTPEQPAAGQPAGQPPAGQPLAGQPASGQPPAGQPASGQPPAGQPASGQPPAGQPPAGQPPAGQPPAGQPPAGQPPAGQPPAGQPPAGQPPAGQPPAGQPPAGQPAPDQPVTEQQPAPIPPQVNQQSQPNDPPSDQQSDRNDSTNPVIVWPGSPNHSQADNGSQNSQDPGPTTPQGKGNQGSGIGDGTANGHAPGNNQDFGNPGQNSPPITIPLVPGGNDAGATATQPAGDKLNSPQLAAHDIHVEPNPNPLPTIGNSPASVDHSGNVVINSQTIAPNAPPVTINHTPVALGTAGLIIGGPSTVEVQSPQPTLAVIGNSPALIDTSGNVVVDNQIITPEAPAVTIHNTPVHLDSAGLVVGSASPIVVTNVPHTTPLATIGNSPVVVDESGNVKVSDQIIAPGVPVTINNTPVSLGTDGLVFGTASTVAVDSSPHYVVGSQRLSPGGAPVIHLGTTYSLAPHATAIVVNGAASAATPVGSSLPVLTIGNSVITPESNSHYIVAGETLAPNGPPLTVSGSTYSLAHDAGAIVVDGITSTFPSPTENVLPILTFGGSPLTPGPSSRYILGGQTLTPGSAAIQISGTTYSLAPDAAAVVVNGITSPLPKPSPTGLPVLTVGDSLRSPDAHSHYIVAGQTLSPGDAPVQISGTTYSIAPKATAVVVNGVTVSSTPTPPPVVNIGASPITANLNSEYVIGSQTLSPAGAPVTVSGTTYSLASHATAIIINGISSAIAAPSQLPLLNIGSSFITANSNSEYIVGSQTLTPAGTPITVSGTTYSLAPHAAAIVVNGISSAITAPSQLPMLNIGSSLLTANSRSEYIIGSQTLAPAGTPIIVSGATYSLASEASAIIINGISTPIVNPSSLPVLNIGSSLITANSNSKYVIGTQTLTPGSAITIPAHTIPATTVSGTTIPATTFPATTLSLSPSAHFLVFNGHTSSLTPSLPASNPLATATSEPRLGAIIYNGFGANPSPSFFTAGGQVFTPSPSSFAIAGTTLVAGGPALTISGTVVSLAPSGTLRIGTSIIPLSTSTSGFSTTAHNTSSSPTASSQALNISASSAPQSAEAEPGRRSVSSAGLVVALGMAVLIAM